MTDSPPDPVPEAAPDSAPRDEVEAEPATSLDAAARRLSAAVESLEQRLGLGPDATGDLFLSSAFDADRQRLAGELDDAQARVRELEGAVATAAAAVDHAVAEIKAAFDETAGRRAAASVPPSADAVPEEG